MRRGAAAATMLALLLAASVAGRASPRGQLDDAERSRDAQLQAQRAAAARAQAARAEADRLAAERVAAA
ncbi:MAG: hypothetical protein JO326_11095, partial [Acetobacteraceae bacterium]|nr:hypothetical protein [Acetobacteraceae bacterium]